MPQPVGQGIPAPAVVAVADAPLLVHVGNVGNGIVAETVGGHRVGAELGVQGAVPALGEGHLFRVGERLVAKDQHAMLVHAGPQCLQRGTVVHLAQVQVAPLVLHLRGKRRMQPVEGQCHVFLLDAGSDVRPPCQAMKPGFSAAPAQCRS